eukprot:gb/GECG01012112.1/.p1 GENE.gb/GECG01012112.1/~~gb/GECG01012112.1/.p1  ORF type:complete len:1133 (+),score=187.03 gb/GECG01012112.1/:1-3399(+)
MGLSMSKESAKMPLKKRTRAASPSSSSSEEDEQEHDNNNDDEQAHTSRRRYNTRGGRGGARKANNTASSASSKAGGGYEEEEAQFSDDAHTHKRRRRNRASSSSSEDDDDEEEDNEEDEEEEDDRTPSKRLITLSEKEARAQTTPVQRRRKALTALKQQKTAHSTGNMSRTRSRLDFSSSSSSSDEDDEEEEVKQTATKNSRKQIQRNNEVNDTVERTLRFEYESDTDDMFVSGSEGERPDDNEACISHNIIDREIDEQQEFEARQEGLGISSACNVMDTSGLTNDRSFDIYCRFLAIGIFYPGAFKYLRTMPNCKDALLYRFVKKQVEERLLQVRESLVSSTCWDQDLQDIMKRKSVLRIEELDQAGIINCKVCRKPDRPSSYRINFEGYTYHGPYLWDTSFSRPRSDDFLLADYTKSLKCTPDLFYIEERNEGMHQNGDSNDEGKNNAVESQTSDESSDDEFEENEKKYTRIKKRSDSAASKPPKRWTKNGHIQKRGFDGALELDDSDEDEWEASSDSEPATNNDGKAHRVAQNKLHWEDFIPRKPSYFKDNDEIDDVSYAAGRFCRKRVQLFHNISHFKLNVLDSLRQCIHQELTSRDSNFVSEEWKMVLHQAFSLGPFYRRLATLHNFPPAPPLDVLYPVFESDAWRNTWRQWFNTYETFRSDALKSYASKTENDGPLFTYHLNIFENEITKKIDEFPVFEKTSIDAQNEEAFQSVAEQWLEAAKQAMENLVDGDEEGDVERSPQTPNRHRLSQVCISSQRRETSPSRDNQATTSTRRRQRSLYIDNEATHDGSSPSREKSARKHTKGLQASGDEAKDSDSEDVSTVKSGPATRRQRAEFTRKHSEHVHGVGEEASESSESEDVSVATSRPVTRHRKAKRAHIDDTPVHAQNANESSDSEDVSVVRSRPMTRTHNKKLPTHAEEGNEPTDREGLSAVPSSQKTTPTHSEEGPEHGEEESGSSSSEDVSAVKTRPLTRHQKRALEQEHPTNGALTLSAPDSSSSVSASDPSQTQDQPPTTEQALPNSHCKASHSGPGIVIVERGGKRSSTPPGTEADVTTVRTPKTRTSTRAAYATKSTTDSQHGPKDSNQQSRMFPYPGQKSPSRRKGIRIRRDPTITLDTLYSLSEY